MDYDISYVSYFTPVSVLGTDDDGRTLVRCPECGEDATVQDDGRIACPLGDAVNAKLRAVFEADLR